MTVIKYLQDISALIKTDTSYEGLHVFMLISLCVWSIYLILFFVKYELIYKNNVMI
jgi:hypothetical protein